MVMAVVESQHQLVGVLLYQDADGGGLAIVEARQARTNRTPDELDRQTDIQKDR